MAHEIDTSTGRAAMAFVGETPWHGLGSAMQPGATIEAWQQAAGLSWDAKLAPVRYQAGENDIRISDERSVLYRSDTGALLGVPTPSYQIVQPKEVVEFFRDVSEQLDCTLETAGALKGGRIAWALARNGQDVTLPGNDVVKSYVLLSTSFDGSRATTAKRTSVRVVCNNTLALSDKDAPAITVSHRTKFDGTKAKVALGLHAFETFAEQAQMLAHTKVEVDQAVDFFMQVYHGITAQQASLLTPAQRKPVDKTVQRLGDLLYRAPGAQMASANGTLWGLLNAVTRDVDFAKPARTQENRLNSAWFGSGDELKQDAFQALLKMAA